MTDPNVPPVGSNDALGGNDLGRSDGSIASIANDFAALVKILERQMDLVSPGDLETRSHILRAKEAAERGAKLSQELMGLAQTSK